MALQASAPALGSVGVTDLTHGDEAGVAIGADVVVALAALVAVEARVRGRNGLLADVAVGVHGQDGVAVAR